MRLKEVYRYWWAETREFGELDKRLKPRSPEMLFKLARNIVSKGSLVLDVGCGKGFHCRRLAKDYEAFGVDPLCQKTTPSSRIRKGTIQDLPFEDSKFDLIWSRAMLMHVSNANRALRECARVLKPAARMIVLTMFETPLMEKIEAKRLYTRLDFNPKMMSRTFVEESFVSAGFRIESAQDIGSEFVEFYEDTENRASTAIRRLLRMRDQNAPISKWPQKKREIGLGILEWTLYQVLGKITSVVYLLNKSIEYSEAIFHRPVSARKSRSA